MERHSLDLGRDGPRKYRLLRTVLDAEVRQFEADLRDPRSAQRARLSALLKGAAGTSFAREHGLQHVKGLDELREAVPIRTGVQWAPWLDRVALGEPEVLTMDTPVQLLETSGTTGVPKLLPVTRAWAKSVQKAQALWTLGLIREQPSVAAGKILTVVSPAVHGTSPGGIPIGSNTGRIRQAQPWWMRRRYAVPYSVAEIEDPLARQYTLLRFALGAHVTSLTTANPSMVLLLYRRLEQWRAHLTADLMGGTLRHGPAEALDAQCRKRLERRLARKVPPIDWSPRAIWPSLGGVNCWTNGPAAYFAGLLRDVLGPEVPVREVGITASEGFFAFPVSRHWPGSVLWLGGHVLEFVGSDGQARWAWELDKGQQYRMVVSTEAGLFRYDLADTVEVVGWCHETPIIRFVGKSGRYLNAVGERVVASQVSSAMAEAVQTVGVRPVGFTVRICAGEVPMYEVAVEGGDATLVSAFDEALGACNVEYAGKRKSGRLSEPRAIVLPQGTYSRYRAIRIDEGAPEGQLKDPILAMNEEEWDMVQRAAGRTL